MSPAPSDFSSVNAATLTGTRCRFTVAAETTAYARVRAVAGNLVSDWSEVVTATNAAAQRELAAPSVRVSNTGRDFIEWTWDPVVGALAYQLQISANRNDLPNAEPFLLTSTVHRVPATSGQTLYLRVRAGAGTLANPIVSSWSLVVAGTAR